METTQVIYENSIKPAGSSEGSDDDSQSIYEDFKGEHMGSQNTRKNQEQKSSGSDKTRNRYYRLATVCLGLLCVILLTTVTVMSLNFIAKRDQLKTSYINLTIETEILLSSYKNLSTVRDHLETSYISVIAERDKLQKKLLYLEKATREGWSYFSSSLYYVSSEQKTWDSSRQACQERGADLVIINSRDEQEFVDSLSKCRNAEFFIGLSGRDTPGVLKWVDGSVLTTGYWENGQPDNAEWASREDCVITRPQLGKRWNNKPCQNSYYWICEKVLDIHIENY